MTEHLIVAALLLINLVAWGVVHFARRDVRFAFDASAEAWKLLDRETDARHQAERRLDQFIHERSTYALRKQNEAMMQTIVQSASVASPAPIFIPAKEQGR